MGYFEDHQNHFSIKNERAKARQVIAILEDALGEEKLGRCTCLHVGCTEGTITLALADHMRSTVGLDVDLASIEFAKRHYENARCSFAHGDATELPFDGEMFDIVVCNHIYNYVSNSQAMINEIHRVLRGNGICYFAATQFGKDQAGYPTNNLNFQQLRKLVANKFSVIDYTIAVLKQPDLFKMRLSNFKTAIASCFHVLLMPVISFFPSYIWILRKQANSQGIYRFR